MKHFPLTCFLRLLSISQIIGLLVFFLASIKYASVCFLDFSLFDYVTLKQKHHRKKKQTAKQRTKEISDINNFYKVMVLLADVGGWSLDVMG